MVFIQSQEYVDSYGKKSKNIINLEGQTDYKIALNPDTNVFDVSIVMGDYEKYLYSCEYEDRCTQIFQNILNQHANKAQTDLFDVNQFMIEDMNEQAELEDLEELIENVLNFMGYSGLCSAWRSKIDEMIEQDELECKVDTQLPNNDQVVEPSQTQLPLEHNITTTEACQMSSHHKYIHYA